VYLRARYLNPAMGVLSGLDRFEGEAEMPLTLNGYGWVEGNTPNLADPNGFASLIAGSCNVQSSIAPDLSNRWGILLKQPGFPKTSYHEQ